MCSQIMALLVALVFFGGGLAFNAVVSESPPSAAQFRPSPFPTPSPLLSPGIRVMVQTVGGEVLYLRAAPSTGAEIVRHLYDGMALELLEGPVYAEGYIWWRVRLADGAEGWAAQIVDTVTTLLPEITPQATDPAP